MTNREKLHEMSNEEFAKTILDVTCDIHAKSFDPSNEEEGLDRVLAAISEMEKWLDSEYSNQI